MGMDGENIFIAVNVFAFVFDECIRIRGFTISDCFVGFLLILDLSFVLLIPW